MAPADYKILVIEDNSTMREGMVESLIPLGYKVSAVSNGVEGLEFYKKESPALVITDYKMNPIDGLTVLKAIREISSGADVILITAYGTVDVAVDAMKSGAADFITKPFSPDELQVKVEKIKQTFEQRRELILATEENAYLRQEVEQRYNFSEIIGNSARMMSVFDLVKKSADSASSVTIYGESGTGKELIARAIHFNSSRKDKPFVKVNCAALTETLLESELFGHEKGAFTGAIRTKRGRFELADTGTLFLDEIGDVSPNMQVRLLRAIQEQEFERVGGETTLHVDVRIITATHRNLKEAIQKGTFREDLYYRLHVIPIDIPPLRDRKEDIPKLVDFFIRRLNAVSSKKSITLDPGAYHALTEYDWPGNVRELENIIERAVVLANHDVLTSADLMLVTDSSKPAVSLDDIEKIGLDTALDRFEKSLIEQALAKTNGGRTEAARLLGVKTSAFYYKLEKYGLM